MTKYQQALELIERANTQARDAIRVAKAAIKRAEAAESERDEWIANCGDLANMPGEREAWSERNAAIKRAEDAEATLARLVNEPLGRVVLTEDGRPAWVRYAPKDVTEEWDLIRSIMTTLSNPNTKVRRALDAIDAALTQPPLPTAPEGKALKGEG